MNPLVKIPYRALFFLITTCLLFPGFLFAQNLVINGGFDLNGGAGTGWTTPCSMEIYPESVYGGTNATNPVTEIDVERCIRQDICVAGGAYMISLKASRRIADATPASPGFTIRVTGVTTGTTYLTQNTTRDNTSWALTPETYTFTIPSGSADKYVTLAFDNYLNTGTYGILIDDIELHPQPDMVISGISYLTAGLLNTVYNFSVANNLTDISYSWSFDAGSTPATSTSALPAVSWSTFGTKAISVAISNGTCTMATLNTSLLITTVLPLEFTRFTGNVIDGEAALTWCTANEKNTGYFMIERSGDGLHYQSICKVFVDSTAGAHSYSYVDAQYTAPAYYRLKEVDRNGAIGFSPVVILKKATSAFGVNLYPSTTSSSITYAATVKQPAAAMVQVINAAGQTMITHTIQLYQGVNAQTLDVSQLSKGQYFLKLTIPANGSSNIKQFNKL
jgi:hypothetical protein